MLAVRWGPTRQQPERSWPTHTAAAAVAVSWMVAEWLHPGKPTMLGVASGIIAGLATITPAAGFVTPLSAMLIGLVAGAVC